MFYPEDVVKSLKQEIPLEKGITILKEWCERFTGIAGPVMHLTKLLINCDKGEDAIPDLERAIKHVLIEKDRDECKQLLNRVKPSEIQKHIKANDFKSAHKLARKSLNSKEVPEVLAYDLIRLFDAWIKAEPKQVKDMIPEIESDFKQFLDKCTGQLDHEMVKNLIAQKQALVVKAATSYLGELDSIDKLKQLSSAMKTIIGLDDSNYHAKFQLAAGCMHLGFAYAKAKDVDNAKGPLLDSEKYVNEILNDCEDDNLIQNAEKIKEQLDQIIKRMNIS
jgi:hypothetical protein